MFKLLCGEKFLLPRECVFLFCLMTLIASAELPCRLCLLTKAMLQTNGNKTVRFLGLMHLTWIFSFSNIDYNQTNLKSILTYVCLNKEILILLVLHTLMAMSEK